MYITSTQPDVTKL